VLSPVFSQAPVVADGAGSVEAPPIDPGDKYTYRNFTTIRGMMYDVESAHPEIAKVYDIGDSWETTQGLADRDILAIKISDNVLIDEDEPEALIVALHHAREWVTSELITEAILNITSSYGADPRVSWLVDNRELWIVPVVNPDGLDYSMTVDSMWRKNRRLNYDGSFGVDLNRNYNGSENGDPAGAWGGVGSSHVPSDYNYCGESPFSEPETAAIRDLTYSRDFQIELDFHSYGEWVMWPWGYAAVKAPDDAVLVSIGNQLAAINGYTAAQSVALYPTTGDSLDWLYGGADVYPFLFEIGRTFQPTKSVDVWGIIDDNMPALFLGIELAGDRELKGFDVSHTPVATRPWSASGHQLEAVVTADRGVDPSGTSLVYRADGGEWVEAPMSRLGNDTYSTTVPSQFAGTLVEYYFVAHDLGGVERMSPTYGPYEVHSFTVSPSSAPPAADAGFDRDATSGALVVFDGSLSSDDVGVENYTWAFVYDGRTEILYGVSPQFSFELPGVYVVTLTVTDIEGQSDTDTVVVSITEIPEFGPVALPLAVVSLTALLSALSRRRREGRR
jgi:hypothetical protein